MSSRLVRLGTTTVGLLGLMVTVAPPAQAKTSIVAAFTGTAVLSNGASYPCTGTGGIDPLLCPERNFNAHFVNGDITMTPLTTTRTLRPNDLVGQPRPFYHHNTVVVSLSSSICVPLSLSVNKPGKPVTHVGTCSFAGGGYFAGHCGLGGGNVVVDFVDALGQHYLLDVDFHGVGGLLVLDGHGRKTGDPSNHGLVVGLAVAVPPTPTSGEGCVNKTARTFTLAGFAAAIPDPLL